MQRLLLVSALAAAAISLPAAATSAPNVTLVGVVGPEMTITLRNADGSAVTHLDPGTYDVSIDDRSILHNFHLLGPGVEQRTDVETIGMTSWTVQFADASTYTFQCDAHVTTMKGTFTVGNVPPPPPPTPKLNAKVTATTISLKTASGAKVRSLTAGKYKVAVNDSAKTQNFHLSGPGVNKKTGVKARTKTTWTVTLSAGKGNYTYRSDKKRRLRGTFAVR